MSSDKAGIMSIEERVVGNVAVLLIMGDMTMQASGSARVTDSVRRALQEGHDRLVLDLRRVRYVDSVGLGDLLEAYFAARSRGAALKLLNVTRQLNDLLVLTKLLTVFECYDREGDALASFGRG